MDYALNEDFDLYFTDWKDFQTVDGREEFEQKLVTRLHANQRRLLGDSAASPRLIEKARQVITRTAREFDVLAEITTLDIQRAPLSADTLKITVVYDIGDAFTEKI